MEKFQYLIVGMGLSLVLIGLLAGGVLGQNNNSTVENETIKTEPPVNVTEEPAIEEEVTDYELSPSDQIAIREGEKAEEAAMSGEEPEEEETDISPVEPSEDTVIDKPIEERNKPNVDAEVKPVSTPEKTIFVEEKKKTLRKTVNGSGFVFVGAQYAGEDVKITFL